MSPQPNGVTHMRHRRIDPLIAKIPSSAFRIHYLVAAVLLTAAPACRDAGDTQAGSSPPTEAHRGIPLFPETMRALDRIPGSSVELEIWRNNDEAAYKTVSVNVNPETHVVDPFPLTLPLGPQSLRIKQFIVDPFFGRREVAQTQAHDFTVSGPAELNFTTVGFVLPLPDDDSDDVPNLTELLARSDPKNALSKPVLASDAQLNSVVITESSLLPNFDSKHSFYYATVAPAVTEVHLTVQPAASNATLMINGQAVAAGALHTLAVPASGTLSISISVTAGSQNAEYFVALDRSRMDFDAKPWEQSVDLSWKGTASSYNLYYYSDKECDLRNYTRCTDGTLLSNQVSPLTIPNLTNGKMYSFRLEGLFSDGTKAYTHAVTARPDTAMLDSGVETIAVGPNGTVYAGGGFTRAVLVPTFGVTLDAQTGQADLNYPRINGVVHAVVGDGAGGWYIGGEFTRVNEVERLGLAHILADSRVDPNWRPAVRHRTDPNATAKVSALAWDGNVLAIGGSFTHIDELPRRNLAAVSDTGTVLNWDERGTDGFVNVLTVDNGTIYVGGKFKEIAGLPRHCFGAVTLSDGTATPWRADAVATNSNSGCEVTALTRDADVLYVGGNFEQLGDVNRSGIAAVSLGGQVQLWNPALVKNIGDNNIWVHGIAIHNGTAYIGGKFSAVGNFPRKGLAAVGLDEAATVRDWAPVLVPIPDTWHVVRSLVAADNAIFLAGHYSHIEPSSNRQGRTPRNGIAKFGLDGNVMPWEVKGVAGARALAFQNGIGFIGGDRMVFHDRPRQGLAAFSQDGVLLRWNPSVTFQNGQGTVNDLEVVGDILYIGGQFDRVTSASTALSGATATPVTEQRDHLAAIRLDGEGRITDFQPQLDGLVKVITPHQNRLFVGGAFSTIDGNIRPRLAAFSNDVLETAWAPVVQSENADQSAVVRAIEVTGNMAFVGGKFSSGESIPQANFLAVSAESGAIQPRPEGWPASFKTVDSIARRGDTLFIAEPRPDSEPTGLIVALDLKSNTPIWQKSHVFRTPVPLRERNGVLFIGTRQLLPQEAMVYDIRAWNSNDGAALAWSRKLSGEATVFVISNDALHIGGKFQTVGTQMVGSLGRVPSIELP